MIEVNGHHVSISRRHPFHGEERIIQFSHGDLRVREVHEPDRAGGDHPGMSSAPCSRDRRRRALSARRARGPGGGRRPRRRRRAVGGTEKLRADVDGYGVPLEPTLEEAIAQHRPDVVLDLSDEPVLGPAERLALASRALALGIPYEGPDFRFAPPPMEPVDVPTLAVIGTGKRVGKTAVTGHVARSLARSREVVVVAMGRGGPPEPETVLVRPTVDSLLELSRLGRHAASDHLETAVVAGVATVGCRRCGGGLAGAVAVSNVLEGVAVARVALARPRRARRERRGHAPGRRRETAPRHVGRAAGGRRRRIPERLPRAHRRPRARDDGRARRTTSGAR